MTKKLFDKELLLVEKTRVKKVQQTNDTTRVTFLHATNPDHSMAATRLPTLLPPGTSPLSVGKTRII